jgi:hypothetical protein
LRLAVFEIVGAAVAIVVEAIALFRARLDTAPAIAPVRCEFDPAHAGLHALGARADAAPAGRADVARLHVASGARAALVDSPITVVVAAVALRFVAVGTRGNATEGHECGRLTQSVPSARTVAAAAAVRLLPAADHEVHLIVAATA